MIENKSLGSKIFDVLNVVFLVIVMLICIMPVWYVLCVSLSSRKPLMQEKLLSGRLASICSPTRRFWEKVNFWFVLISIKRVVLGTLVSMVCVLMAAFRCQERKSSSPIKESSCGFLYFVCYSTVVLFHGISL